MSFTELFNVFSKRPSSSDGAPKPITKSFRNRVFMRCQELFQYTEFWDEIYRKLAYLHGKPRVRFEKDGQIATFIGRIRPRKQSRIRCEMRGNIWKIWG